MHTGLAIKARNMAILERSRAELAPLLDALPCVDVDRDAQGEPLTTSKLSYMYVHATADGVARAAGLAWVHRLQEEIQHHSVLQ